MVDLRDPGRRKIDAGMLAPAPTVAGFQGVVLPDQAPTGLPAAELAVLHDYERRFGVRQIDASVVAAAAVGLAPVTDTVGYSGTFDGGVAQLTAAALGGDFGYARGPVPFSDSDLAPDASWVEIARPLAGFRTLLTATSPDGRRRGSVAGIFSTDGREELVLAFSYDVDSTQLQVLAPGLVAWVTRGVHLGLDRSYLAVHVDDVLLPNVRWVPGVHCTPGADCPPGAPVPSSSTASTSTSRQSPTCTAGDAPPSVTSTPVRGRNGVPTPRGTRPTSSAPLSTAGPASAGSTSAGSMSCGRSSPIGSTCAAERASTGWRPTTSTVTPRTAVSP